MSAHALESSGLSLEERRLLKALREGDESAFASLLGTYHSGLVNLAMVYVRNRAVAEEVVQEAWLGVIRGLERFEGRSSLKTWIFRIVANIAKTRSAREGRSIPFSALGDSEEGPSVDPRRFGPDDHWSSSSPASWETIPEERLQAKETLARIQEAIERLPASQRAVVTLRDVQGWSSEEVCELLGISEGNQRVLLHRARTKVRGALEQHLG
jgi:RNA polymerase sigma-70 factor (ECF subfamily)